MNHSIKKINWSTVISAIITVIALAILTKMSDIVSLPNKVDSIDKNMKEMKHTMDTYVIRSTGNYYKLKNHELRIKRNEKDIEKMTSKKEEAWGQAFASWLERQKEYQKIKNEK